MYNCINCIGGYKINERTISWTFLASSAVRKVTKPYLQDVQ